MIEANYIARRRKTEDSLGERTGDRLGINGECSRKPQAHIAIHSHVAREDAPAVGIVGILTTKNHHAMGDAPVIPSYENGHYFFF